MNEAEVIKIEHITSKVQCYIPKYLGWVIIPDNNYKKGDKINISISIGIVYYCTIFVCIFFFIGGFVTMFEE